MMLLALLHLEFARPTLLLGLLVLPWLIYWWRRSLVDLPFAQRCLSLAVRSLLALCLVLALAGLNWLKSTQQQFVVVAVDRSASVGREARAVADRYVQTLRQAAQGQSLAMVEFAEQPGPVTSLTGSAAPANESADAPATEQPDRPPPDALGTDLAAAVELAAAVIPPAFVPQIVLLTDGHATRGNVLQATLASRVPISTVPLPAPDEPEVQLAAVQAPASVREGEPFSLEVAVNTNQNESADIEIFRDGVRLDTGPSAQVTLQPGENRFRFSQQLLDQRRATFQVRVSARRDTRADNNTASTLVATSGLPQLLLIDSDLQQTDSLRFALEEQSIRVTVRPADGLPDSLAQLQNFDAVMLSNVPATALTLRQMETLRSYVQDLGGGLLMIGGDQSFGLGGYADSPLEEILPLRTDFEKEQEKPSLALMLLIDRSGSMGGQKLELAKDAARAAVELLGPEDQIGVIAFDDQPYWISQLHPAADKQYVLDRIATMVAGGGTNIYPAMREAQTALQKAVARLKHLILLTDGISAPGDFPGITAELAAQRITVSTVAVGQGADQQLLQQIARQGRGRYYYCDKPQSIPQVFAKETVAASKSSLNETPFLPVQVRATPVLKSIDLQAAPVLLGFVVTRPKPTSEVILVTETGEPLLAWWRYGLGMSLAFTSDASSRWAAEWLVWQDFPAFWAQCVRHTMRNEQQTGADIQLQRQGDQTLVQVDLQDAAGQLRCSADVRLHLMRPQADDKSEQIQLLQSAPGRYTTRLTTTDPGAYLLDLEVRDRSTPAQKYSRGFYVGYPDELQLKPTDEALLRRIAEMSGGQYDPQPLQVFQPDRSASRVHQLWPHLLSASLILLLLDVALRRIDLTAHGVGMQLGSALRS